VRRRGRHRKIAEREPNGQAQRRRQVDRGTPEVQNLRKWWAGDGDPALSSFPLGILLANCAITERQYTAACEYAFLHWSAFGRPSIAAVSFERRSPTSGEGPDRDRERVKIRQIVDKVEAEVPNLVGWERLVDLLIYEITPGWMRPRPPTKGDVQDAASVCSALVALTKILS
jgi:hypothetical protein